MEQSSYCEVLVKVVPTKLDKALQRLLWSLCVFFFVAGIVFFLPLLLGTIACLAIALVRRRRMNLEYEYQYLDGSLRIDRIIAMSKRKKAGRYELENLAVMAPEGDERLQEYLKRPDLKRVDYSSRVTEADNRYVMVFHGGGTQYLLLNPTPEMVQLIWRAAPSKVVRKRQS